VGSITLGLQSLCALDCAERGSFDDAGGAREILNCLAAHSRHSSSTLIPLVLQIDEFRQRLIVLAAWDPKKHGKYKRMPSLVIPHDLSSSTQFP
jgi:hypothetical protein